MKRRDLVGHLREHGCVPVREGGSHTVFTNVANDQTAALPRHTEIKTPTVRAICQQLGIPIPRGR
ncbi:MAG: type II toxin-antitoxin system HicA family toxin [Thermoanaerobaculia bacterium]